LRTFVLTRGRIMDAQIRQTYFSGWWVAWPEPWRGGREYRGQSWNPREFEQWRLRTTRNLLVAELRAEFLSENRVRWGRACTASDGKVMSAFVGRKSKSAKTNKKPVALRRVQKTEGRVRPFGLKLTGMQAHYKTFYSCLHGKFGSFQSWPKAILKTHQGDLFFHSRQCGKSPPVGSCASRGLMKIVGQWHAATEILRSKSWDGVRKAWSAKDEFCGYRLRQRGQEMCPPSGPASP